MEKMNKTGFYRRGYVYKPRHIFFWYIYKKYKIPPRLVQNINRTTIFVNTRRFKIAKFAKTLKLMSN